MSVGAVLDRAAALYPNLASDLFDPMRQVNGIDVRLFEVPAAWPESEPALETIAASVCTVFQNPAHELLIVVPNQHYYELRQTIVRELLKTHPVLHYSTEAVSGGIVYSCGPTKQYGYKVTFLHAHTTMLPHGISASTVYVLDNELPPPKTPALEVVNTNESGVGE